MGVATVWRIFLTVLWTTAVSLEDDCLNDCCYVKTFFENIAYQCKASEIREISTDSYLISSKKQATAARYLLYHVNEGEGFNLRRDVFVRIAPVVEQLNRLCYGCKNNWILVLPPWTSLPHWRNTEPTECYDWGKFFDINVIRNYIPVIEMKEYLSWFKSNPLDAYLVLENFDDGVFIEDRIQEIATCRKNSIRVQRNKSGTYFLRFWNQVFPAKISQCLAFQGSYKTLAKYLSGTKFRSVMIDNAEVVLWEEYGGTTWWNARKSLVFSHRLKSLALSIMNTLNLIENRYAAAHIRRRDFLHRRESLTWEAIFDSFSRNVDERWKRLFIATDDQGEAKDNSSKEMFVQLVLLDCEKYLLDDGDCSIIDQIICSKAEIFIGTDGSTFTQRIFEERELLRKDPSTTYNIFCKSPHNRSAAFCSATRWSIR